MVATVGLAGGQVAAAGLPTDRDTAVAGSGVAPLVPVAVSVTLALAAATLEGVAGVGRLALADGALVGTHLAVRVGSAGGTDLRLGESIHKEDILENNIKKLVLY